MATRRILQCLVLLACVVAPPPTQNLWSADDPIIIRVEEDWRIEIGSPSSLDNAPQLINVISPLPDTNGVHGAFEINHATLPDYTTGGTQIQTWNGNTHLGYKSAPKSQELSTDNETITYTIGMGLKDNAITYEVRNGKSQTWGTFGHADALKLTTPTSLANLNTYASEVSVKHSRVGFATRRVKRFVLLEVRYYTQSGQVLTDSTDRTVHSYMSSP
ncbi:MAG: hypothetical protein ABGZ17_14075 [Planctomycetaceae bacterium]